MLDCGLSTREELDRTIEELRQFAEDPRTVVSIPRVVQAWGVNVSQPA
jgi:hypothetical protein